MYPSHDQPTDPAETPAAPADAEQAAEPVDEPAEMLVPGQIVQWSYWDPYTGSGEQRTVDALVVSVIDGTARVAILEQLSEIPVSELAP